MAFWVKRWARSIILVLPLPQTSFVVLGKPLNVTASEFSICRMVILLLFMYLTKLFGKESSYYVYM